MRSAVAWRAAPASSCRGHPQEPNSVGPPKNSASSLGTPNRESDCRIAISATMDATATDSHRQRRTCSSVLTATRTITYMPRSFHITRL